MKASRFTLGLGCALAILAGCSDNHGDHGGMDGGSSVRGSHGEKLTVVKPHDQVMQRGGTEHVTVWVKRKNFNDAVQVSVSNLPAGVEAVDTPRSTNEDKVEIVLRASDSADMVSNHQVMVTAEGPNGMRATEKFGLSVKERS